MDGFIMAKITGRIEIDASDGDWKWIPDSLSRQDLTSLESNLKTIETCNPASGLTFKRHIAGVREGCQNYLSDNLKLSKCLLLHKNI